MGGDIYLRNDSGATVKAKVNRVTKTMQIAKTEKFRLDSLFKTKVDIYYQNKKVLSTTIQPSTRNSKFKIYRKNGAWLIESEKYYTL